jgi:UDP-N-acetylglucosamine kinase
MSDEELINSIERLLNLGSTSTNEQMSNHAYDYIKSQKKHLPNKFLTHKSNNKKAIFMAGGSGAGKSETALNISINEKVDVIDTDEIRKICPMYSGVNSHLFQRASSKGVSILIDYLYKNNLSFILDGNFADYKIQKENIKRAVSREYAIEIIFVYRDKEVARTYTKEREKIEGRIVPNKIFEERYTQSIINVNTILEEFTSIELKYIDLTSRVIYRGAEAKKAISLLRESI